MGLRLFRLGQRLEHHEAIVEKFVTPKHPPG
jgi:hypothetical protein